MAEKHWKNISASRFPWEQEALDFAHAGFPAQNTYTAWSNFEFVADDGSKRSRSACGVSPRSLPDRDQGPTRCRHRRRSKLDVGRRRSKAQRGKSAHSCEPQMQAAQESPLTPTGLPQNRRVPVHRTVGLPVAQRGSSPPPGACDQPDLFARSTCGAK